MILPQCDRRISGRCRLALCARRIGPDGDRTDGRTDRRPGSRPLDSDAAFWRDPVGHRHFRGCRLCIDRRRPASDIRTCATSRECRPDRCLEDRLARENRRSVGAARKHAGDLDSLVRNHRSKGIAGSRVSRPIEGQASLLFSYSTLQTTARGAAQSVFAGSLERTGSQFDRAG